MSGSVVTDVGRVRVVAGGWDGLHLDLAGAGALLSEADTGGFTAPVRSTAASFARRWATMAGRLAGDCEHTADALRRSARALLAADARVAGEATLPWHVVGLLELR